MKLARMFFVSGILVLASSLSVASGSEGEITLQRLFDQAKDLRITRNEALASSYPDTECVDFSFKKSKVKVGFVCTSKKKDFAREMGISEYDALPEGSRPKDRPESGCSSPHRCASTTCAPSVQPPMAWRLPLSTVTPTEQRSTVPRRVVMSRSRRWENMK
jgi:hypothetical protein